MKYRTTKPNGRLAKKTKKVGKFTVEVFIQFDQFGYRVMNADGEEVVEVLDGTDAEFEQAREEGQAMADAAYDDYLKKP